VVNINWDEYKEYKRHSHEGDNFEMLLGFMRSYYNMNSPDAIYESLNNDVLAQMMLEKRDITDAEDLEKFLFKRN